MDKNLFILVYFLALYLLRITLKGKFIHLSYSQVVWRSVLKSVKLNQRSRHYKTLMTKKISLNFSANMSWICSEIYWNELICLRDIILYHEWWLFSIILINYWRNQSSTAQFFFKFCMFTLEMPSRKYIKKYLTFTSIKFV